MNDSSPSSDKRRARHLIVTILIGTAAAAVTAGVALNERHPAGDVVQRADATPAGTADARRVQWRDPWRRPAPLSESASTSIGDLPESAAALADPSLPTAAEALGRAGAPSGEDAPTF